MIIHLEGQFMQELLCYLLDVLLPQVLFDASTTRSAIAGVVVGTGFYMFDS